MVYHVQIAFALNANGLVLRNSALTGLVGLDVPRGRSHKQATGISG